jgi:signal transduction histidine kinase
LYTHLLVNGLEARRDQYLAILQRETDRLQQLIEDLLLLSRLDLDSVEPIMREVDVNQIVGNLVEDRKALAQSHNLELSLRLCPGALITMADEKMLSQAVTNLLANATNYTPAGGHIRVSTLLEEKGSQHTIVISVTDTGLGLNPEDKERLFDRFFRGAAAQSTGSAGTGLGMSIVKEIVDRHKGRITVESEPGRGSTFSLCLPVTQPVRAAEAD